MIVREDSQARAEPEEPREPPDRLDEPDLPPPPLLDEPPDLEDDPPLLPPRALDERSAVVRLDDDPPDERLADRLLPPDDDLLPPDDLLAPFDLLLADRLLDDLLPPPDAERLPEPVSAVPRPLLLLERLADADLDDEPDDFDFFDEPPLLRAEAPSAAVNRTSAAPVARSIPVPSALSIFTELRSMKVAMASSSRRLSPSRAATSRSPMAVATAMAERYPAIS